MLCYRRDGHKKMKYKEIKRSELKKGNYVSDVPLDRSDCSIFIFDHMNRGVPYFTPYYNCDMYGEIDGFVGFAPDFPCFKISKKTADKYIKDHEEKI